MDDFKVIARLLVAKLQRAGYIEGLAVIDGVSNQAAPFVAWDRSKPAV